MVQNILEIEGLSKSFGGVKAVSDLSFELEEGEILGLIGPNGAGKTTVFNLIAGVISPDSGSIKFEGGGLIGLPPYKIRRKGIAKTYQAPQIFLSLTVMENLLVASTGGQSDFDEEKDIEYNKEILEILKLDELQDEKASMLSPRELKRLEVARGMASKPRVLLLDEPAAGVRGKEARELMSSIKKLNSMGVSIILIEHRMSVMRECCTRAIALRKGSQIAAGTPQEVVSCEVVKEAYLGGGG